MRTAWQTGCDLLLVDGPPGIGCPLISTISGMDAVLIVTEPSVSALHDLGRLVTVCRRFGARIFVAINRFDLAETITREILAYCEEEGLTVVGLIPFDPLVIEAVRNNQPVTRMDCPAAKVIGELSDNLFFETEESVMVPERNGCCRKQRGRPRVRRTIASEGAYRCYAPLCTEDAHEGGMVMLLPEEVEVLRLDRSRGP